MIQENQNEKSQASLKNINIEDFKTNEKDTGSSSLQVALLTQRVRQLTDHFKTHKKDFHSQMGLMKMINRRKKLLSYLKRKNVTAYKSVVQKLGLRK